MLLTRFVTSFDTAFCRQGSSSRSCDETYCGRYAFSEPCTKALANLVRQYSGRIAAYFAVHSYSQLWMFPYGYTYNMPSNYAQLVRRMHYELGKHDKTCSQTRTHCPTLPPMPFKVSTDCNSDTDQLLELFVSDSKRLNCNTKALPSQTLHLDRASIGRTTRKVSKWCLHWKCATRDSTASFCHPIKSSQLARKLGPE